MLLFKKLILFFTCTILLCSSTNQKEKTIRFPQTYQLSGKSLHVSEILGRTLMFKIKEDKLIIRDDNWNSLITIIDLENPENYIYTGKRGQGPGEIINPSGVILTHDGFSVFDAGKMKLFNFNMSEVKDETYLPETIFSTKLSAIVMLEQLTDSLYITTGIFPENRFYFLDKQGEVIAQDGMYPFEFNKEYPFHVKGMACLSGIAKSPKENKIATATLYGGHIGVYEVDTQELVCKTISETSLFSPEFTTHNYAGAPNFAPMEDTRWGYLSITADENYIYALYSGKYQRPGIEFTKGNTVHVFNWKGQPTYEIILDNPAYRLDVYQNKLYTLYTDDTNDGSFEVAQYELP